MRDAAVLRDVAHRLRRMRRRKATLPLHGYEPPADTPVFVDRLADEDLVRLNRILDWNCFTIDAHGRRFGDLAWAGKRDAPMPVPDPRLDVIDRAFGLAGRTVLEIGCFEGAHTVGLCRRAARVVAIDARVENVVKTIVRTAMYDCHPTVLVCDIEAPPEGAELKADLVHHVGVLYHLRDPVRHLLDLGEYASTGVMLDTHYVEQERAVERYELPDGSSYAVWPYPEPVSEVFAGVHRQALWLTLDGIQDLLARAGFSRIEVVQRRQERNGPRVLMTAGRTS